MIANATLASHEHEMVPDYPIPPYAWHFKCAATGCDYATDSFQIPKEACAACTEKDAEIRRLREDLEASFDAEHITAAVAVAVGPASARRVRYWLKKAVDDLAAHQAVVRELAEALEGTKHYAEQHQRQIGYEVYPVTVARRVLAHSLVVAARKAP